MRLEFSRQILEMYTNMKFNENPSSGSRVVPCGQTDRYHEVILFLFANMPARLIGGIRALVAEVYQVCN